MREVTKYSRSWKLYMWIYKQLCWCTVEQACSDEPTPWWNRLARKYLPDPYDFGKAGAGKVIVNA